MASVSFRNVEKSFGSTKIIHGIGFDIADGEFTVLVGPSGCGKSTLLRMLAGLEEISGGTIAIDDHVVNDIESKDRDIAMVFQSYALYPHMTVGENMGFSLRLRNAEKSVTDERVSLGVGLSWVPEEFTFTHTDWATRASRFEEMIEILRLACGGGGPRWIEHHGRHYQFERLMISPSPQLPVPIIIGGHSDAAIRRAARIADGWVGGRLTVDELVAAATALARYRVEFGTEVRPFEIAGQIVQKPDAAVIATLEEAGLTELQVLPWLHYGGEPDDLDTRVDSLYRFADEFITNR